MKVLFSFSSAFVICICRQTFQFNSCQCSHGGTVMYVHVHKILYLFRGTVVNYMYIQTKECQATAALVYDEKWNENKRSAGEKPTMSEWF